MKKRSNIIAMLVAVLVAVAMIPVASVPAYAEEDYTTTQVVSGTNLERGVTVVPNGNIYAISGSTMYIYNSSGTRVSTTSLPSAYCGNLCSDSDGYVFAHDTKYNNNKAIYVFAPGSTYCKTVYSDTACTCLATDPNGYLYSINNTGTSSLGKKATKIFRAKIADIAALSSGATITWESEYQPNYDPPADSKICYPGYFDVDGSGNAYIADLGTGDNGSNSNVNGIYKCNLNTGECTAMYFTKSGNGNLTWVHGVTVDDFGNVSVVGRNSNTIAIFRKGSTFADKKIGVKLYPEDVASDKDGNVYYITHYHNVASNNGVGKITLNNVRVESLQLSPAEKSIEEGTSFTLTPTVSPSNATNKDVLYSSSNTTVATVSAAGVVSGVKEGTATITARTVQGGFTAKCTVTVTKTPETPSGGSSGGSSGGLATVDKVKTGTKVNVTAGSFSVTSVSNKTVAFTKAKNKKSVVVPDTITINKTTYKVTQINAKAFTGKKIRTVTIGKNVKKIKAYAFRSSPATKIIVKSKKLTKKSSVKGCLKKSKVKTVQVKVGSKSLNKKYVKKYKKVFTKANAGRKVTVK